MFVTNLEIEHFRGIQKGNISFPLDSRVICMIGAGDSTKSTVIKAIEWVFWPSWNLIACDNDFYGCDTSVPIIIRGTFKEIPSKLITEDKFGLYLRKPHVLFEPGVNDEPEDGGNSCLTIQLTSIVPWSPSGKSCATERKHVQFRILIANYYQLLMLVIIVPKIWYGANTLFFKNM